MEVCRVQPRPLPLPTVSRESKRRILNASTLKALVPPPAGSVDHFDDLTPGLSLRITSNDVRTLDGVFSRQERPPEAPDVGALPSRHPGRRARTGARGATDRGEGWGSRRREARRPRGAHVRRARRAVHRGSRQAEQAELGRRSATARCESAAEVEEPTRGRGHGRRPPERVERQGQGRRTRRCESRARARLAHLHLRRRATARAGQRESRCSASRSRRRRRRAIAC